ncbi:MAG: alpha/beta hydrolase, partial [Legionella sp.]
MTPLNITIPGFNIAGKSWGDSNNPPILALHGWLDNANSFEQLAEILQTQYYFIAIDLPGHGHSSHLPLGCNYHFTDGIFNVIEIMNALELEQVHLLGHSMGACLGSLVAGVSPERFLSLSLIEGLGPFSHPADTACKQLSEYLHNMTRKGTKKSKGYQHFVKAVEARAASGYVSQ